MTTHSLLQRVLDHGVSVADIASELSVAPGTVKRWIDLKKTPRSYEMDLARMLGESVDYTKYSYSDKDQFFTLPDTAKTCFDTFCRVLRSYGDDPNDYHYIEPSAGSGVFLNLLPPGRRTGLDIEPRHPEVIAHDFLTWKPVVDSTTNKYVVIGNPPFGLRGNMALRFINACVPYADYVCFILPQLFESDGKGSTRKRVKLHLIHNEKLTCSDFQDPDRRSVKVECIFQIWSKHHVNQVYERNASAKDDVCDVYSLSDGGTPSSTRNKSKLQSCDVYLPSTCYGKDAMRAYESFEALPNRRGYGVVFREPDKKVELTRACFEQVDWSEVAFHSTNSALNLRKSSIVERIEELI